jgi:AcrR family transcriptional regulator
VTLQTPFASEASNLGKSARTRARLMDAATHLFARDGFEAASVNEIAKLAGVANGTFYVHFRDKDEIAATVVYAITASVVRQLNQMMAGVDDAVARVAVTTRRFIEAAASRADWGRALFRAVWTFRSVRTGVIDYLRADLERGVAQGAFTTPVDEVLIDAFVAVVMNALQGRVSGAYGPEAGARTAELQLRMLGVDAATAHAAAWAELPALSVDLEPAAG